MDDQLDPQFGDRMLDDEQHLVMMPLIHACGCIRGKGMTGCTRPYHNIGTGPPEYPSDHDV
jgi:hypothetical protein